MKVIHFSYMDDCGAGIAAVRYHKLMQEMGITSTLYVCRKTNKDDTIVKLKVKKNKRYVGNFKHKIRDFIRNQIELFTGKAKEMYCFYDFDETNAQGCIPDLLTQIDYKNVDFVFIHWLGGFINSYDMIRLYDVTHAKFIFSMMDLEPVTGGCHYPWLCNNYATNCMDCPALGNGRNLLAHNQLTTKMANYAYLNADIFSSALYDLELAKKSIIKFNNYYQLYYPIDENIFVPSKNNKNAEAITLFANVNAIGDPRKGFNYLLAVLLNIDKQVTRKVSFLCLSKKLFDGYKFKNISFEEFSFCKNVNDLVSLYQRTDIFLCASIEDSAPMMLQEALLCGIPAITFDTGVGKQFIEDGKQGYVVPRYDIKAFEEKLLLMIEDRPNTIQSADEIHEHMVSICGKKVVSKNLRNILNC